MEAMLRREEELRLSEEVQAEYAAVEVDGSDSDWMDVTDELQRAVAREFGATARTEAAALHAMRQAAANAIRGFTPLYVRFQRAREGDLTIGERLRDCPLLDLHMQPTTLHKAVAAGKRVSCVLAGSYS